MIRKLLFVALLSMFFSFAAYAQDAGSASTAAEKPKKAAVFRPTKDQIRQVQGILKTKGIYSGEANGSYNEETRAGIRSYQEGNGLKETGTLNRATLEKFGVELTESQKLIPVSQASAAACRPRSGGWTPCDLRSGESWQGDFLRTRPRRGDG